jgi:hypothetical protein
MTYLLNYKSHSRNNTLLPFLFQSFGYTYKILLLVQSASLIDFEISFSSSFFISTVEGPQTKTLEISSVSRLITLDKLIR